MSEGQLPDDARYFRAVVGDQGVSVSPDVRSPTVREGKIPGITRSITAKPTAQRGEFFSNEY